MAKHLSTNTLIDSAVRRSMIPKTNITFKEEDFLAFANEEMGIGIVPLLLSFHEDYLLTTESFPLVSGVGSYAIPYRAIGNKIRDVSIVDPGGTIYELTRVGVDDLPYYQYGRTSMNARVLNAFYVRGNEIVLLPEDAQHGYVGTIKFSYYQAPSELVSESRAARITNITGTSVTLNTLPSVFTETALYDACSQRNPFNTVAKDFAVTISGTVLTVPSDVAAKLKVGDLLNLAEECIIPQIPTELHSMLAQRVAMRCLDAIGDMQALQSAMAKLAEMEVKTGSLVDNRVEGAPMKVNPKRTFLRGYRGYFRG